MKKFWTLLLTVLLACSVVLNVYLVAIPPVESTPTEPSSGMQNTADKTLTSEELEIIEKMIASSLFGLRGEIDPNMFSKYNDSYERVYDLVYNLYACSVDTDRRVIKVEFINLTDEMVDTFRLIYGDVDYIEIINLGEGTFKPGQNTTLGGVSSDPTEGASPSAE